MTANGLSDPRELRVGQILTIPGAYRSAAIGTASSGVHRYAGERASRQFLWPVQQGVVSSGFGIRNGAMHSGVDIAAPVGTPVLAADSGVVIFSGTLHGYGNTVIIRHDDGYATVYGHNERNLVAKARASLADRKSADRPHWTHHRRQPSLRGAPRQRRAKPPRLSARARDRHRNQLCRSRRQLVSLTTALATARDNLCDGIKDDCRRNKKTHSRCPGLSQARNNVQDFTPLIADARGFAAVVDQLAAPYLGKVDAVVGIESRGFIVGAPVAYRLGVGLAIARKPGKLPSTLTTRRTISSTAARHCRCIRTRSPAKVACCWLTTCSRPAAPQPPRCNCPKARRQRDRMRFRGRARRAQGTRASRASELLLADPL